MQLTGATSLPPRKRNVRVVGAPLGFKADLLTRSLDLRGQGTNGRPWIDTGPERSATALLETSDALDAQIEPLRPDARKGIGNVVGEGPFDLADEAQCQVKLFFVLPAKVRTVVHCVDEQVTDEFRRTDGDEQSVHGLPITHTTRLPPLSRRQSRR